ncbi:hypothetical protein O6H91_08G024100 [Diphasiastrum complanatum]|uniref:Uncharacterized protein n=1 Tax=Diphasiastrum complanatum TaxID=34168 RepID=A0ACC2CVY8_DIPCM|nr:hypothetical protein O6H91_08G024100 [Diphasiastrum complanatum]
MKRSWSSFSEGHKPISDQRRVVSAALLQQQKQILHSQHSRELNSASVSLPQALSDACASPEQPESASGANGWKESPSESANSRETWPKDAAAAKEARADKDARAKEEDQGFEQAVLHRVANTDRIQLRDIAGDGLDILADRMRNQPEEYLSELKSELRDMLSGSGGSHQREQFSLLKNLVQNRTDLTPASLLRANRTQLEIIVAINTGIQAFLHPDIVVTQSVLIEIFFQVRCRNMACQSQLPVDDCNCDACTAKNGFCKACMCAICSKFDFDVNTCRWIGCDVCSHWTHTDCASRVGQIGTGSNQKGKPPASEMIFRCRACGFTSKLLGWVKDVFKACAADWNKDDLMRELNYVRKIFYGSEEDYGKRLFWKCEELLEKLKNGIDLGAAFKELEHFFQDMEVNTGDGIESNDDKIVEPRDACNRITEVVHEAMQKMEIVYAEKLLDVKRARLTLEMCDRELDDKRRELGELQFQRQNKTQQIEELQTIVRLKQAEAEMFQNWANEAQREADKAQRIAQAKSEKAEEDYASRYLKLRLYEAEAERRCLFEKIKLQDYSRMQI